MRNWSLIVSPKSRNNIAHQDYRRLACESMSKLKFPLIRSTERGLLCLSPPFNHFKMDVERNPGPCNTCTTAKIFETTTYRFVASSSTNRPLIVNFNYNRTTLMGLRKNYTHFVQPTVINQLI